MVELSVILPVYNERVTLPILLSKWSRAIKKLKITYEFVLCEDGSTDGTQEIIKSLKYKYPISLNQKKVKRGYGKAVQDGIKQAKGKWLLSIDSDGQCDPLDLKKFWKEKKKNEISIGWRVKRADSALRRYMSFAFRILFQVLFPNNYIHDPSAPFVLYEKNNILKYIDSDLSKMAEGFWWGFVAMSYKRKIKISEIKIHHHPRYSGITQVYRISSLPRIILNNIFGLIQIKFSK